MNSQLRCNAAGLPEDFEPEYARVEQEDDHTCLFAVIAMVAGRTAKEIRAVAKANLLIPERGPFSLIDDGSMAAYLAAHHSYVAGVWKECGHTYELPDLCILLVEVTEKFSGRHILFARQRNRRGFPNIEYVIDPYWVEPQLQVRTINDLELSWYISLHPMAQSTDY